MPRKKTHEEFLEDVKKYLGDDYEPMTIFRSSKDKIKIKHMACGFIYETRADRVKEGRKCKICSGWSKNTKVFKKEVFELVGNEYDVLGEYKNSNTKILFKHNKCSHEYEATPNKFLNGRRCPKCFGNHKKTTEQYKKDVYDLVGDEYEVLGEYHKAHGKIAIRHNNKECNFHISTITPAHFLFSNNRCAACFKNYKKTTEQFKQEVYDLVKCEYTVLGEYDGNKNKIKMKHNSEKCNNYIWGVAPQEFLGGKRCPKCNESKGEKKTYEYMVNNNIDYITQYKIEGCRDKRPLPFDFAILNPDKSINCLIEYDGIQHFEVVEHFGGEEGFKGTKKRDQIKNQYCKDNNIKLIRIPYWDFDNIEDILNEELKDLINNNEDEVST